MTKKTEQRRNSGKLVVEGCNTASQEHTELRKRAKKSKKRQKLIEAEIEQVPVRVDRKTTLYPTKEKYLKNKEYYDNLYTEK